MAFKDWLEKRRKLREEKKKYKETLKAEKAEYQRYLKAQPGSKWEKTKEAGRTIGKGIKYPTEKIIAAPSLVRRFFSGFVKFVFGIIVLVAFALLLVFLWGAFTKGFAATLVKHAEVGLETTVPGKVAATGVLETLRVALTGGKTLVTSPYTFEAVVEDNKENPELGVRISEFYPISKTYYAGEPMQFIGTVRSGSLAEEMKLRFSCNLEDYKGTTQIKVPTQQGAEIIVYKDQPQVSQIQCLFPQGIETTKDVTAKKATLTTDYDFNTNSYLTAYFLDQKQQDYIKGKNLNPFGYYRINEPNLKGDNTITSISTAGPVSIGIGSKQSQPFSENVEYFLGVTVKNNEWFGQVDKLKKLDIYVSPLVQLTESPYCDFVYAGKTTDGFDVYELKSESPTLKKLNTDCELLNLTKSDYSLEDCLIRYKSTATFTCNFRVTQLPPGKGMFYDFIRAQASYTYETKQSAAVNIIKQETIATA